MKRILALTILFLASSAHADFSESLATYRKHLNTYGDKICAQLSSTDINDTNLLATYYDFQRVAFQAYDYTGDSKWLTCANYARLHYRDSYVIKNDGRIPGYWIFAKGLAEDYRRNGNAKSLSALNLILANAAYCNLQGSALAELPSSEFSREAAYCTLALIAAKKPTGPFLDFILGHFVQWQKSVHVKPFMVGLSAEALITYYETVNKDPRIKPALIKAAERLWAESWNEASQSFFYESTGAEPAPDLNQLIAPLYMWLWKETRDISYRDKADKIFMGGVAGAYLLNGKQFNQSYRWSFDLLKWRDCGTSNTLLNHDCRLRVLEAKMHD